MAMVAGCVSHRAKVQGPTGGKAQVISCYMAMDACYDEAREFCGGNYRIDSTSTVTNQYGVGFRVMVTCEDGTESSEQADTGPEEKTPASHSAVAAETPAPTGGGGFTLGMAVDAARAACEKPGYQWSVSGETANCSDLPESVGFPGTVRLRLCGSSLCEVRLELKLPDARALSEYRNLRGVLSKKYGEPKENIDDFAEGCDQDVTRCLNAGSMKQRASWSWSSGTQLTLKMVSVSGKPVSHIEYSSGGDPRASAL